MKIIRTSCFETNSSACHTIVVHGNVSFDIGNLLPNQYGVVKLECENFGWGPEIIETASSKAAYLIHQGIDIQQVVAIVKEVTKAVGVLVDYDWYKQDYNSAGEVYYDCRASDGAEDTIKDYVEGLSEESKLNFYKDFIFNPAYKVLCNGDTGEVYCMVDNKIQLFDYDVARKKNLKIIG